MAILNKVSHFMRPLLEQAASAPHGAIRQASLAARVGPRYLEQRSLGPPTIKLKGGSQAFLHGSTKERFSFEPGQVFNVNESKFFFAPLKDAAAYALGNNTSCLRKIDNDSSQPLIVLAVPDQDTPLSLQDVKFAEIGSGWWFVESGIRLRVGAAWIKNTETGLMEPYKQENWVAFLQKDFEDLTGKIRRFS
jgi:hypothetical protein